MRHLKHEFFSTISSMNSFSRSSRLNPHCPGGAGLWAGGDEKARRVIHRASFKDPSQSPKYSSQMLIFKWLMSSSAPEQSEDLIFFLCSMVFFWKKKMCQMETFEEKLIFFQTLLLFCFYCCCYSFQTLPFFHPSSHSSLSLFQRRVTVV